LCHFTSWLSPFAEWNYQVYSQASRSKFVLIIVSIYMSSIIIIIILKEKGVMQTSRLADV